MQNYFNYFTEIEERFQQRRGSLLMLSTLDWALIETWREAGIPLEAVLRGIDSAFDKYDAKPQRTRTRKVNGLAWCSQAVMEAVEQATEASIGTATPASVAAAESGFESERIAAYLRQNAVAIQASTAYAAIAGLVIPGPVIPAPADSVAREVSTRLTELADNLDDTLADATDQAARQPPSLEALDRTLTVLEEKLFAALLTATPEQQLVELREQASRELAPYRGKMQAVQIKQVQQQLLQKRLLEAFGLPRLSLFYMSHH